MGNTLDSGLDMKAAYLFKLTRLTTIATLGLLAGDVSSAQSPSGPITAAPTQPGPTPTANPAPLPASRTTILGAWKFNPDDSDDPRKRREDSRDPNGGYGRGRMGGGYPGGGHGGFRRPVGGERRGRAEALRNVHPAKRVLPFDDGVGGGVRVCPGLEHGVHAHQRQLQ